MGSSVGFGSAKCVGGWWVSIEVYLGLWNFHCGTCGSCKSCVVFVDVYVTTLQWCSHKMFSFIFLATKKKVRKNLRLTKKIMYVNLEKLYGLFDRPRYMFTILLKDSHFV